MYQKPTETNDDYMERFQEMWNTAEAASREIPHKLNSFSTESLSTIYSRFYVRDAF